jgi:RHH-type transcriptional regulator, rel operon repressor / antitoxin RelB
MMAKQASTLALRLPEDLAAELEQLAEETGRSKSYYARQAIIEFLEDRSDYLRAIATIEKREPRLTLAEAKKALGLDD